MARVDFQRVDFQRGGAGGEREFFIDNLLVRIYFIAVMIRWTGLAPWEFEFPFPGSLTSTFLTGGQGAVDGARHRVGQPRPRARGRRFRRGQSGK